MRNWTARLEELGIKLPAVAAPVAAYVPAIQVGNQVWTSGQLPFVDGELPATGKVGAEVDQDTAYDLARTAVLNAVAAVDDLVGVDKISRVVKIVGFVASDVDFHAQPAVVNGASEAIQEIFGDQGVHARSAVGVAVLPLNSPVEVELIVEVED
ncbi:RidA family protein [Corynebacterium cystitidis]|uniref:Enamine deaminase RidA, house cleaning of reactive enamine intermediates, YjgF/YER057c/UK114 family n=1 Tax=Corynebacterium cystitidis DSM 20524 TaxID=1121357 RepID=A0A1H9UAP7_9CORY|nr:RidA family protein [Corynebacterium cystitidis]WJY81254.1 Enamine/imine deaminase [Corynebacterium cystitidis DSM 20524]SES06237.1 Enamine deaminase RidA, house cleaning of reactive enamine intermediates, YjgF/YER057c/UK114 family [Corynebacterium cystitidis DSM 20524]SNV88920.1 RutC family protein yabJ [Corynebacterium cystitidis]